MKRSFSVLVIAVCMLALACNKQKATEAFVMPQLVARPAGVAPDEFAYVQKQAADLQKKIANNPNDIDSYSSLAQLYMNEARITGNHHYYYPAAQSIVNEALRRSPNDFIANAINASLQMTFHQFQQAKKTIEAAIAQNQFNAYAYGVLCDAQTELGAYDDAIKTCDKMMSIRPGLSAYARASYQRELHGDDNGACEAMKMAAEAGLTGQESREWSLYSLANLYLRQGLLDTAEFIYNGILEERPNYGYALSGLAQIHAARKDYPGAIELLVKATQATPEHIFLEQLADIYAVMGQTESANTIITKVLDAYAQHEKDGWDVDKEYAMFCANHSINLPQSLERAKNEYNRRPDNIDALDTYAWVLYKNGNAGDAEPYIERALRLNTDSPIFFYHAAMICQSAGQTTKAADYIKRATGPHASLPIIYSEDATKTLHTLSGNG